MYEVFEHTADLGLRVRAPTLDDLFADAGRGLFAILVANLDAVRGVQQKSYEIAGREADLLLVDWLSELLYTFEAERLLLAEFDVRVDRRGLLAVCHGEPVDLARHQMDYEVKAITYHELKVAPSDDGWLAQVVVDI
jgi:SHS2 domain-containing protein